MGHAIEVSGLKWAGMRFKEVGAVGMWMCTNTAGLESVPAQHFQERHVLTARKAVVSAVHQQAWAAAAQLHDT